jgi:hypothetical protein
MRWNEASMRLRFLSVTGPVTPLSAFHFSICSSNNLSDFSTARSLLTPSMESERVLYPSTLLFGANAVIQGQIVVGTLQTIAGQLGPGGFGHGYFDLVVTDECHRSIYNTHRATLAHFDAIHIGLTATLNPGATVPTHRVDCRRRSFEQKFIAASQTAPSPQAPASCRSPFGGVGQMDGLS